MKELAGIFKLSCLILAVILFGIIPFLPKAAAYSDFLFANVLGLPFNSGAVTFGAPSGHTWIVSCLGPQKPGPPGCAKELNENAARASIKTIFFI